MSASFEQIGFEQIDSQATPMGVISLRRRREPSLNVDVYEVKLGDEFLMSSLFTVAEIALAELALAELDVVDLDVVVGGLGLGYTARAALADPRVRSLRVVEALEEVIGWHRQALLPFTAALTTDRRCQLVHGDFFAMVAEGAAFGEGTPNRCHAVLVDIDHTPKHLLHPSHAAFYEPAGLQRVAERLQPGGVFALWADGAPDENFVSLLDDAFASCAANVVTFPNFYTDAESASTVYVAKVASPTPSG